MTAVGDARKRLSEAETALSRPASPQPTNSPSDALAGPQGVEAIRARLEAATPGPWVSREIAHTSWIGFDEAAGFFRLFERRAWATAADDAFVTHARTDIPLLLAALDEARAEVAENERLMIGMRNARDRAEAVVESVRELADWPVGRPTSGVDRMIPASDVLALLPKGESAPACDHPGIEHSTFSYTGICPKCRRCKFIGHGPLCGDCYETTPTTTETEDES